MKKLISLAALTLLLTACNSYTVATSDDLKNNPELEPVVATWQDMVDAGNSEDCSAVLDGLRKSLSITEESCPVIFAYLQDAPTVDWSRTDWNADGGKAKIYAENGASITSFIYDTRDEKWRADTKFWEE